MKCNGNLENILHFAGDLAMAIAIIITFAVIAIFVMAFKKNTSETTVTREDENCNIITEHHETVHHTAGQSAARVVVEILVVAILLVVIFLASVL